MALSDCKPAASSTPAPLRASSPSVRGGPPLPTPSDPDPVDVVPAPRLVAGALITPAVPLSRSIRQGTRVPLNQLVAAWLYRVDS